MIRNNNVYDNSNINNNFNSNFISNNNNNNNNINNNPNNINNNLNINDRNNSNDLSNKGNINNVSNPYQNLNLDFNINDPRNNNMNNQNPNNKHPNTQNINSFPNNNNFFNNINNNSNINNNNNNYNHHNNMMIVEDIPMCQVCKDINITYLDCLHPICLNCFKNKIETELYSSKCSICSSEIKQEYIKNIIGNAKFHDLESKLLQSQLGNGKKINCTKCKEIFMFEIGNVDYNQKDDKGFKLSAQMCEDFSQNRCKCPYCKVEFCANCKLSPYHRGMSCDEFSKYQSSSKCRFCEVAININNKGPTDDVCSKSECISVYSTCCKKKLPCDHNCLGHIKETDCIPCLIPECKDYYDKYNQNSDEFCVICYTESLQAAPIVKTECGHYYHYHCIKTKLENKWVGPKITFNYAQCSQCNSKLNFPNNMDLQKLADESKKLEDDVLDKIIKRMKLEGLDKDKKLTDPNSIYYNKPIEFGKKSVAYNMCYKCKKPYFAGLRDCLADDGADNRQHDPKDLICGGCGALDGVAGINDCKKHGKEFIEYKCKFCCDISCWFCWGTTHFCEKCHAKQCKGEYVTKIKKCDLPKCPGENKCPLKIKHPDNGEEFALGCSICKNDLANNVNF